MTKTRLHFQPIRGKALDIIDAILQTREVTSTGRMFRVVRMSISWTMPTLPAPPHPGPIT